MSRSSARRDVRGQVHPLPALVAVLALTVAVVAYANVTSSVTDPTAATPALPALKQVEAEATTGAVLDPPALDTDAAGVPGHRVNVTLDLPTGRFALGPTPPDSASGARVHVAAATDDRVVPGELRVEVWPWTAA